MKTFFHYHTNLVNRINMIVIRNKISCSLSATRSH